MGPDNQIYSVGIDSESDLFTLADQAELNAIAARLAPEGIQARKARTDSLKRELGKEPTQTGKAAIVRRWKEDNAVPFDDDLDSLIRLRDKAHHAKTASMDSGQYQVLMSAVAEGFVSQSNANDRRHRAQAKARYDAFELANGLFMDSATLMERLDQIAELATDEDKAKIVDEFEEFNRWERAKEGFKARYEAASSLGEKAELRAKFPDLARAVYGF